MPTTEKLLTAEDFFLVAHEYARSELIRGEIVPKNRPGLRHGMTCAQIVYLLKQFNAGCDVGHVACNDSGVITERDPDTVRGADVLFYFYERLPRDQRPAGYTEISPNFVFEVRSPQDRWNDIYAKIAEYLNAGVECVCVLVPEDRTARLFYPDDANVVLGPNDELTLPAPLDEFRVRVTQLFE